MQLPVEQVGMLPLRCARTWRRRATRLILSEHALQCDPVLVSSSRSTALLVRPPSRRPVLAPEPAVEHMMSGMRIFVWVLVTFGLMVICARGDADSLGISLLFLCLGAMLLAGIIVGFRHLAGSGDPGTRLPSAMARVAAGLGGLVIGWLASAAAARFWHLALPTPHPSGFSNLINGMVLFLGNWLVLMPVSAALGTWALTERVVGLPDNRGRRAILTVTPALLVTIFGLFLVDGRLVILNVIAWTLALGVHQGLVALHLARGGSSSWPF